MLHGEVIEYDSQRDLYRIRYTDDGEEELTLAELLLILTETPHSQVTRETTVRAKRCPTPPAELGPTVDEGVLVPAALGDAQLGILGSSGVVNSPTRCATFTADARCQDLV